jgi:hypothetical protein
MNWSDYLVIALWLGLFGLCVSTVIGGLVYLVVKLVRSVT